MEESDGAHASGVDGEGGGGLGGKRWGYGLTSWKNQLRVDSTVRD